MKKNIYIIPESLTIALCPVQMMAESLPIGDGGGETIENPGEILTKENKDVNLWDEEW